MTANDAHGAGEPGASEPSATEQDAAAHTRATLELLAELGCGYLESGLSPGQAKRSLERCGAALGLDPLTVTPITRTLWIETTGPDGATESVTATARSLDLIDCTRSKALGDIAAELEQEAAQITEQSANEEHTTSEAQSANEEQAAQAAQPLLTSAKERIAHIRDTPTPWWIVAIGTTLLAFFISMQVGVSWRAWVSAAIVQLAASLAGRAIAKAPQAVPRPFAVAIQASLGGAIATILVQLDFVDPVGAAAAIAVNWLLLLPLPQVIGAVTDAIEAEYFSALARLAGVLVAALGIFIGGSFTFMLGELLHMEHPRLDSLPSFPWYLVLVFSALGAVSNAFANGGTMRLVVPAAALGIATGAVNQLLLGAFGLPQLWANSFSAVVLGALALMLAPRTGYPYQVLALMGITGALLPGIPVFFGILQEMGGASGLLSFGTAGAICLGLGTGVALGAYLTSLMQRKARAEHRTW